MRSVGYLLDDQLAMALHLATQLEKPVLLEGLPGVGKTEVAVSLANVLDTELIRLQCYEGIDVSGAIYEWNYAKQMVALKSRETGDKSTIDDIFSEHYLLERPLLRAIRARSAAPVLLIDEVDRADEEFEAFLLEVLDNFQISIPEFGTIKATIAPIVILTSNRTRTLHDALRRRCLYHWLDYPDLAREIEILVARVPGIDIRLATQIGEVMQAIRETDMVKKPGVAETVDWAESLLMLGVADLTPEITESTLSCIVKYKADLDLLSSDKITSLFEATSQADHG